MKTIVHSFAHGAACVIGMLAGMWVWTEVLEGKANNLKDRLESKKEES